MKAREGHHWIDIPGKGQDGIMLYLTTDGFVDQHNPRNRRYGSRRFKVFLRDHAHMDVERQGEILLEELKNHQADEEQRDDITVIGLRLLKFSP